MMRERGGWLLTILGLILLAAASAPAFPQGNAEMPAAAQAETPAKNAGDDDNNQTVETILRQQEELLRGQRFFYDPSGRRDPFRSLYEEVKVPTGPRPRGIAGMLVAEVDLVGIVQDASGGDLAFFTGSDNKGYFLRVGDAVFDGTLIAVDRRRGAVTFRQQVNDPRLIKPYRDVTKSLVPSEENQ